MKKSLLAVTLALAGIASAVAHPSYATGEKQSNPAFEQAMKECHAQAGVELPTKPQDGTHAPKQGEKPPVAKQGEKPKDPHHGGKMDDSKRTAIDSCMKAKGFERPAHPQGQAPAQK